MLSMSRAFVRQPLCCRAPLLDRKMSRRMLVILYTRKFFKSSIEGVIKGTTDAFAAITIRAMHLFSSRLVPHNLLVRWQITVLSA